MDPPAAAGGGEATPKLGAGAPKVGAGAAKVDPPELAPNGLALGAADGWLDAALPKLKTPAGAGGLCAEAPKLKPALAGAAGLDAAELLLPPPNANTPPPPWD